MCMCTCMYTCISLKFPRHVGVYNSLYVYTVLTWLFTSLSMGSMQGEKCTRMLMYFYTIYVDVSTKY